MRALEIVSWLEGSDRRGIAGAVAAAATCERELPSSAHPARWLLRGAVVDDRRDATFERAEICVACQQASLRSLVPTRGPVLHCGNNVAGRRQIQLQAHSRGCSESPNNLRPVG